jgi:hypothetical protein
VYMKGLYIVVKTTLAWTGIYLEGGGIWLYVFTPYICSARHHRRRGLQFPLELITMRVKNRVVFFSLSLFCVYMCSAFLSCHKNPHYGKLKKIYIYICVCMLFDLLFILSHACQSWFLHQHAVYSKLHCFIQI